MKKEDPFFLEETFHKKDHKSFKKEKKKASSLDRSKYKKTDQKKKEPLLIDPSYKRGRVISFSSDQIEVKLENKTLTCSLKGSLKKEKSRKKNLICVGDFVWVDALKKQVAIVEDRFSFLARVDPVRKKEHYIAVNVDQVFITCSVFLPPLRPFLIDRYIIAAHKGGMTPIIVVNKIDLLDKSEKERIRYREFLSTYQELGMGVFPVSTVKEEGLEEVKKAMEGKTSVFSGQSGVGKSSLLNLLLGLDLKVGDITEKKYRGKHTTTKAHLIELEGGGFCIDTPGIKHFGLWELTLQEVQNYYVEIKEKAKDCKYPNCKHLQEPDCAVKASVDSGEISYLRFESYQSLLEEVLEDKKDYA